MTEEILPPEGEGEENLNPDTDTGDEGLAPIAPAIPVAPVVESEPEPPAEEAPPPAPSGPRVFPQQYTMLFANTCILMGCLTIWERAHVTGMDIYGFHMIGGSIVAAFAAYAVLAGVVGLVRGGVNFLSTLGTGFFALYFAIKTLLRTVDADKFEYFGDLREKLGVQEAVNVFLGQIGPGVWLNLFGGAIIILMFLKAMFGGKKKEAPAPARRRGRR